MKEWPAAASVVMATREHQGVFFGVTEQLHS